MTFPQPIKHRRFRNINNEMFDDELTESLSAIDSNSHSCLNDYLHVFNSAIETVLDKFAPFHISITPSCPRPLGMDQEYIDAHALRRRLQKRNNKEAYNQQRKFCTQMAKNKHANYYSTLIANAAETNQQQFFTN